MSIHSLLRFPDPPDLLRRFVDTPLQQMVRIGGKRVLILSNHHGCLDMLSKFDPADAEGNCDLKWTMICDPDLPADLGEASLVESAPVALLSFGRACFMALHRSQKELTGFISIGVSEQDLDEVILPRVRELIGTLELRSASHA